MAHRVPFAGRLTFTADQLVARGSSLSSLDTLLRLGFVACVFTGLRAGFNRVRARLRRRPALGSRLHGARVEVGTLGPMRLQVHRRPRPDAARVAADFGMISARQERPRVKRALYCYLALTSHFGSGHLEVAFYEARGQVTIYAVRNTAQSSARRLGWKEVVGHLGSKGDDLRLVRALATLFEREGVSLGVASGAECVELALTARLVAPRALQGTRASLERKYRHLHRALSRG